MNNAEPTLKELQRVIDEAEDAYVELEDACDIAQQVVRLAYDAYAERRIVLERKDNG